MTLGALIAAALALIGLAYIVAPLLREDALVPTSTRHADLDELRELQARRQMLLGSLKDLEHDRATDKVSERDYRRLKARLSARAIDVLRRLDEAARERQREAERERRATRPLPYPGTGQPDRKR
jgi:hypothetical protein